MTYFPQGASLRTDRVFLSFFLVEVLIFFVAWGAPVLSFDWEPRVLMSLVGNWLSLGSLFFFFFCAAKGASIASCLPRKNVFFGFFLCEAVLFGGLVGTGLLPFHWDSHPLGTWISLAGVLVAFFYGAKGVSMLSSSRIRAQRDLVLVPVVLMVAGVWYQIATTSYSTKFG